MSWGACAVCSHSMDVMGVTGCCLTRVGHKPQVCADCWCRRWLHWQVDGGGSLQCPVCDSDRVRTVFFVSPGWLSGAREDGIPYTARLRLECNSRTFTVMESPGLLPLQCEPPPWLLSPWLLLPASAGASQAVAHARRVKRTRA